jgi:hypothetical protein
MVELAGVVRGISARGIHRMERNYFRRYPRVSANFPVEYTQNGGTYNARALTLGGGGLFLGISTLMARDTQLTVRFRPARHFPTIVARARVRHQLPDRGVGIEFMEIEPEHRQMILRLIHHRMAEKRRFPRVPLAAQVVHEGGTLIGFSRQISPGGMFIDADQPVTVSSTISLLFHLDDGGPIVKARAEVLYVVAKLGIGVHFVELSPGDQSRIEAYVSKAET